jgi:hypothetical protein
MAIYREFVMVLPKNIRQVLVQSGVLFKFQATDMAYRGGKYLIFSLTTRTVML